MKKMIVLMLLFAISAVAAETPPAGFWDALKAKVEKVAPRKKSTVNTAVGGVRSAKQQDGDLYWKGKEKPLVVDEDELDLFKQGMRAASAGQRSQSIQLFQSFLKGYPQSRLKEDCLKALEQLKSEH